MKKPTNDPHVIKRPCSHDYVEQDWKMRCTKCGDVLTSEQSKPPAAATADLGKVRRHQWVPCGKCGGSGKVGGPLGIYSCSLCGGRGGANVAEPLAHQVKFSDAVEELGRLQRLWPGEG